MLGTVHQNHDQDLSAPFGQYQSPNQLHTVAHEGHIAHLEVDPLALLISKKYLARTAVGERDNLAVSAIGPPICAGPCTICLWMKLAPLTSEHQPAQCVAIRQRNIYCPAVAQAIRADMAVLDCIGPSRDNRERKQKRKDPDGISTFMNLLSRRFSDDRIDLPADATPFASCLAGPNGVIGFHESSFGRGEINAKPDHSHSGGRALPLDKSAILG